MELSLFKSPARSWGTDREELELTVVSMEVSFADR